MLHGPKRYTYLEEGCTRETGHTRHAEMNVTTEKTILGRLGTNYRDEEQSD